MSPDSVLVIFSKINDPIISREGPEKRNLYLCIGLFIHDPRLPFRGGNFSIQRSLSALV
jgi:hypothetical protein